MSLLSGLGHLVSIQNSLKSRTNPMTNPFKDKPWFKFLSNKYVWVLLFFSTWMIFLDNYSYFDHRFLDKQIDELEDNKEYYQQEIKKDQEKIKQLKNPAFIEKYAREKYYMKKDSEDIYIIEFEGDTIEKDVKK
jgi:cell division protein FtsB